jgi:hypothetical protein
MQAYSDPSRKHDAYSLPDVEVWKDRITILRSRCGEFEVSSHGDDARGFCPSCWRATCVVDLEDGGIERTERSGWWYWHCLPGCLPDSSVFGPFATEAEALADAQAGAMDDESDDESTEGEV